MLPGQPILHEVWCNNGLAITVPFCGCPFRHFVYYCKIVQQPSFIETALHRLKLEERQFGFEFNWYVRARQTNVGEQRTEPAVGFYNTLIELVALAPREIRD